MARSWHTASDLPKARRSFFQVFGQIKIYAVKPTPRQPLASLVKGGGENSQNFRRRDSACRMDQLYFSVQRNSTAAEWPIPQPMTYKYVIASPLCKGAMIWQALLLARPATPRRMHRSRASSHASLVKGGGSAQAEPEGFLSISFPTAALAASHTRPGTSPLLRAGAFFS